MMHPVINPKYSRIIVIDNIFRGSRYQLTVVTKEHKQHWLATQITENILHYTLQQAAINKGKST